MATATRHKEPETARSKWKAHTDEYLRGFESTAEDIKTTAAGMKNDNMDDAEAIVEMAIEKVKKHATEYRASKKG